MRIVGHAQKVRLITKSPRKDDRLDARTLARLARTAQVNAARGLVKS
jgi:hypothetical protein